MERLDDSWTWCSTSALSGSVSQTSRLALRAIRNQA